MDKDEIIKQITSELLEEIKSSNKSFSNEEVKSKINAKLDAIFNDGNSLKSTLDDEDEVLNSEFTKIDSNEDSFALNFNTDEDFEDDSINDKIEDKKESGGGFFQEVADIYKNEFNNSISCFRNALESFKMVRKTSFFETILIVIFLAIPAILAGCIALIIVLILFLLWQLYLITKSIFELLKKAEISIKGINEKIRKKIKDLKSGSGGFLNKLIFSNALYLLMMFNGIMYMLVKGLMLPVKSILDVEKILTNVLAKIERGITTVLKAPSELALASTNEEALKSNKRVSKEKSSKTKSERKKTAEREKFKEKLKPAEKEKTQIRPQQQKVKLDEVSRALREAKLEVTNAIAKNLQAETSQQKAQEVGDRAMDLAERSDRQRTPMSSMLSPPVELGRTDIAGQILDNVLDVMRNSVEKTADNVNRVGGNDGNPALTREYQRINEDYQRQLDGLNSQLRETNNPDEAHKLQAQMRVINENQSELSATYLSGQIQNVEELREVQRINEANDPRQLVEQMVRDSEMREVMLGVVRAAEEGKVSSEQMPNLLLKGAMEHLESKGLSSAEIEERLVSLAPVIEGVKEEHHEIEQQRSSFKEENLKQDRFVNRLESGRENRESLGAGLDK